MTNAEAFDWGVRRTRYKYDLPLELKDVLIKKWKQCTQEEKEVKSSFRRGIQLVLEECKEK
jgi:hypothetical protein